MKLNQIKVFESVARHRTITGAAEELHLSQPAVSTQLKRLEEGYSKTFLKRGNRGVALTKDGEAFLEAIAPLLAHAERVDSLFKSANRREKPDVLTVGGNHTLSVTILAEALCRFRENHSEVQVILETKDNVVMEECVKNSKVEIALISNATWSPLCVYEKFHELEIVACVHPSSPLAGKTMSLEQLTQQPLVVKTGSSSLREFERLGFELNLAVQCDATEAVRIGVQRALGVGIVFKARVESEIRSGHLAVINVPELEQIKSRSFIIYRKHGTLSKQAQAFMNTLHALEQIPREPAFELPR